MFKKLALLLLIAVPASIFLLLPGFYEPHDLHHVADIYQMIRAFQSGQFPPRLGPDYIFGYGYPLFNFYYVIPFYLGAAFFFLTTSITLSFKLVFITSILVGIIGMYLLLKELVRDRWSALVGTVLFMYTPYRAVQIYVRGAMGEAAALAILPFFVWSIVRVLKNPRLFNVAVMGIVGAIFILSHNYFWALSAPLVAPLVFVIPPGRKLFVWLRILLGGVFALGLSFYWWFPALLEQNLVSSTTPFPLIDHFPFIKQLILPSWGYGASLWGPSDGLSFQIGVTNLAVFASLLFFLAFKFKEIKEKKVLSLFIWLGASMAVYVFMMNVRSYPLWKILPFHNFVQFPWRLLAFTTFLTAVMAAVVASILPQKTKYLFGTLVILGSFVLTINYFQPSQRFFKTDNQYLERFFANRSIEGQTSGLSKQYLQYSEDYLQNPTWQPARPKELPTQKITSLEAAVFDVKEVSAVSWEAKVNAPKPSKVTFYELYFPGWMAQVDGKKVEAAPHGSNGEIEISVDAGVHTVRFYWQETPLRKIADIVTLAGLALVILILVKSKNEKD